MTMTRKESKAEIFSKRSCNKWEKIEHFRKTSTMKSKELAFQFSQNIKTSNQAFIRKDVKNFHQLPEFSEACISAGQEKTCNSDFSWRPKKMELFYPQTKIWQTWHSEKTFWKMELSSQLKCLNSLKFYLGKVTAQWHWCCIFLVERSLLLNEHLFGMFSEKGNLAAESEK